MKKYTCYSNLGEKIKVEGAPEGSKEDVLKWMKERFETLETGGMTAAVFFYDGDCDEYLYADNSSVYLAEIVDDANGGN